MRYYFTFYCLILTITAFSQCKVVKEANGYALFRDGKPYYVKGVGGQVHFDKMVEIGANSLRTWGIEDAEMVLDEAHKRGLTVMLGFWLQHERHGFDYDNKEKVQAQFNHFKAAVNKFKNHPALLMWGIGNELDLNYTNPNCWYAVQEIAKYIHQVDPNHPTSTVTAGLDSMDTYYIRSRCPDIDIYCINTYGDIEGVPSNMKRYGWDGPYMITEWGPNGYWESPKTSWGVSIEQTSTEKFRIYEERYKKYIEPNKSHCLGSYAFLWGAKQEYTETWFGLFSKDNLVTEPIDALQVLFTEKPVEKTAPSIKSMSLNDKTATDNVTLKAESKNKALLVLANNNSTVRYKWRIIAESTDKKSGGDKEEAAAEISGLIRKGKSNEIEFFAPKTPGQYRLFVSAMSNDKLAYANIPFLVLPKSENEKQSRAIQFKYVDMKSFE